MNTPFNDLSEKRVLVIGGSGVLGSAIAAGYVECGARVAISATGMEKAAAVADRLSTETNAVEPLEIDACDKDSLLAASTKVQESFGGLDVLINCAGGNKPGATIMPDSTYFDIDLDHLRQVIDLNLIGGGILPALVFGEGMCKQKSPVSIIHVSSMAALQPLTRVVAYSAAKAALTNFTLWLSVELAEKFGGHVRVNAIAPGFFLTDQNRFLLTEEGTGELTARGKTIVDHTPMKEFGKPEDLQGVSLWLGSEASRFVTGTVIPVDGGFSAFSGV